MKVSSTFSSGRAAQLKTIGKEVRKMQCIDPLPLSGRELQQNSKNMGKTCRRSDCLAEQVFLKEFSVYTNSNVIPAAYSLQLLLKAGYVFTNHISVMLNDRFDSSHFHSYFAKFIVPYVTMLQNTQSWAADRRVLFEDLERQFSEGVKDKRLVEPSFLQSAIQYSKPYTDGTSLHVKKEPDME